MSLFKTKCNIQLKPAYVTGLSNFEVTPNHSDVVIVSSIQGHFEVKNSHYLNGHKLGPIGELKPNKSTSLMKVLDELIENELVTLDTDLIICIDTDLKELTKFNDLILTSVRTCTVISSQFRSNMWLSRVLTHCTVFTPGLSAQTGMVDLVAQGYVESADMRFESEDNVSELLVTGVGIIPVIYRTDEIVRIAKNSKCYLISSEPQHAENVTFTHTKGLGKHIVDTDVSVANISDVSTSMTNFYYEYACALYATSQVNRAFKILSTNLKDAPLSSRVVNSFSPQSRTDLLLAMIECCKMPPVNRNPDTLNPFKFTQSRKAVSVVDIIAKLSEKGNKYVPFHPLSATYERTTARQLDADDRFVPKWVDELIESDVKTIVSQTEFNISIRFKEEGSVKLNARQAAKVNLPTLVPSHRYRTHALVHNGQLAMDRVVFKVTDDTARWLRDNNVSHQINEDFVLIQLEHHYLLNENNTSFEDGSASTVAGDFVSLTMTKNHIMVLNQAIHEKPLGGIKAKYTKDQKELLADYGMNKGTYQGTEMSREKGDIPFFFKSLELSTEYPVGLYNMTDLKNNELDNDQVMNLRSSLVEERTNSKEELQTRLQALKVVRNNLEYKIAVEKLGSLVLTSGFSDLKSGTSGDYFESSACNVFFKNKISLKQI